MGSKQIDGEEPFAKLNFAILKDRPDPDAKLFAAFSTFEPFVSSIQDIADIMGAIGTFYNAIPTQSSQIINTFLLIREVIYQLKKTIEIS